MVLLILYKVKLYHILGISIAFVSGKTKIEKFPRLKVARAVKTWVKSSVLRYLLGNLRIYLFCNSWSLVPMRYNHFGNIKKYICHFNLVFF